MTRYIVSGLRFSAKKAPTAAVSSEARWTNIPGWIWVPATCLRIFWRHIFTRNSRKSSEIQGKRERIWKTYFSGLQDWAEEYSIGLPYVPDTCEQPYHMFYILLPSLEYRQALINHLKLAGISAVFHYLPLHTSEMGDEVWRKTRRLSSDGTNQ